MLQHSGLTDAQLGPRLARLLAPASPLPAREMVARGLAALTGAEPWLALYHLWAVGGAALADEASRTAADLPSSAVLSALVDPHLPAVVLDFMARRRLRSPEALRLLVHHPRVSDQTLQLLARAAPTPVCEALAHNQLRWLACPAIAVQLIHNPHCDRASAHAVLELGAREGVAALSDLRRAALAGSVLQDSPEVAARLAAWLLRGAAVDPPPDLPDPPAYVQPAAPSGAAPRPDGLSPGPVHLPPAPTRPPQLGARPPASPTALPRPPPVPTTAAIPRPPPVPTTRKPRPAPDLSQKPLAANTPPGPTAQPSRPAAERSPNLSPKPAPKAPSSLSPGPAKASADPPARPAPRSPSGPPARLASDLSPGPAPDSPARLASNLSPGPAPISASSPPPGPASNLSPGPAPDSPARLASNLSPGPAPISASSPPPGPASNLSPGPAPGSPARPAPRPLSDLSPGPAANLSPGPARPAARPRLGLTALEDDADNDELDLPICEDWDVTALGPALADVPPPALRTAVPWPEPDGPLPPPPPRKPEQRSLFSDALSGALSPPRVVPTPTTRPATTSAARIYADQLARVLDRRTPLTQAMSLLHRLRPADLRRVADARHLADALVAAARRRVPEAPER